MTKKFLFFFMLISLSAYAVDNNEIGAYFRVNQMGYKPSDSKISIVFSKTPVNEKVNIIDEKTGQVVKTFQLMRSKEKGWGTFGYYYSVDFSDINTTGRYYLISEKSKNRSVSCDISETVYDNQADRLLEFMQQQRCGFNPFYDTHCHQKDGVSMYGTITPDSTYVDASGGWHDAGDQLKYLITSSYATAHMLMAFQLYPKYFGDKVDAFGKKGANGIPDLLDEAKWGLDWLLKIHPNSTEIIHQVADDRDHSGWKYPNDDISDYGWGKNSYRVAYFANGKPQGLKQFKSQATGVANLAGRSAAALALAARIWKEELNDEIFAKTCLASARSLYQLGREKEGFQQGNSYSVKYRYNETTWADDMEWGAAELYKATGEKHYLDEAIYYSKMAENEPSWIKRFAKDEEIEHYELYPFINLGHYSLFEVANNEVKNTLAGYYKSEIEKTVRASNSNPYSIGIPFIWCSNNLLTSLVTQIILYEKMTGDMQSHNFMSKQRDWLFGRNPWGTSMFTGFPKNGDYPVDVHTGTWKLTRKEVVGGLVDGPVYSSIYKSLLGIMLENPDEYAYFQNNFVVYHDDIGDYSTNEPTMDGTAGSMIMMAAMAAEK